METIQRLIDWHIQRRNECIDDPVMLERIDRRIDTLTTMMIELHYD